MKEFLRQNKKWLIAGLLIHLIAPIFSIGYLHPDEHFQILEFLGAKLGITPLASLPWEYAAKMRPWTQPGIYFLMIKLCQLIGIEDRFFWTVTIRIFSSLVGYCSLVYFAFASRQFFTKKWQKKWNVILLMTLWFIPFIHSRISSEAFGGSIFLMAVSFFLQQIEKEKKGIPLFISGALFGFSFLIRYQLGFMIAPLLTWAFIYKKIDIKLFVLSVAGIFTASLLGVLIDYWGYGTWTFAPYQYLYQNIFENKAANYGTSPWWEYFRSIHQKAVIPFSTVIILSFLYLWIKDRKHLITWTTFPFFLVHSLIGHKEWRFLFPLAPFAPYALLYFFERFEKYHLHIKIPRFFYGVSLMIMIISIFRPAHPAYDFFQFTQKYPEKITELRYWSEESPYNLHQLPQHFYNFHYPNLIQIRNLEPIADGVAKKYWLFTDRYFKYNEVIDSTHCKLEYKNYPDWILKFAGKYMKRSKMWALFKCEI